MMPDTTDMIDFKVANWVVLPCSCEITRVDTTVKLEPKVMDLLVFLASRPGEVLSRTELETRVWPGSVLGYETLTKTIGKLREALGDTDRPPTFIQTIPKKGYRLIAPVRQTPPTTEYAATLHIATEAKTRTKKYAYLIAIGLSVTSLVISTVLYYHTPNSSPTSTEVIDHTNQKPTIAVLPFTNLDADPQQDYFTLGITDDLITDLSRYSGITVIASRTVLQYRGREVDLDTLTRELGVRYVVEGSIRRSQDQVRINVQMIDAQQGINLWAERYNRPVTALFDIQDEVRKKIFNALSVKFNEAVRARERIRYTNSYPAYDAFLRGQASLIKRSGVEDYHQAREQFETAIALDPGFARAYAALALAHAEAVRNEWVDDTKYIAHIAMQQARHALELDPKSSHATLALSSIYLFIKGDHAQALAMAKRTLQADPNNADAHIMMAMVYVFAGEPNKAEPHIESGKRLNPNQSAIYTGIGALSNLLRGNYEAAHAGYTQSLLINPDRLWGKIYMTVTLVRMNRLEDARWYAEEVKVSTPNFNTSNWALKQPYKDQKINQQLESDLRKAGL